MKIRTRLPTENKALGSRSPGGPRERGVQWVKSFRRVNQLTNRDGSGDEDLAAEEPAFGPFFRNGIVALLWDPNWCSTCCLDVVCASDQLPPRSLALRSCTWARSFFKDGRDTRYWNTGRGHPHLLSDKAHKQSIKIPIIRTHPLLRLALALRHHPTFHSPRMGYQVPQAAGPTPAGLWESRNGRHPHFRLLFWEVTQGEGENQ